MSLQVWLPLDGDLHNQGASGAVFSKAANVWGAGKIGAQALLTSTGTSSIMVNELKDQKEFSIAYWIKIDSSLTYSAWQDIWALDYTNATGTYPIRDEHTNAAGNHQLLMAKETNTGGNTNGYIGMTIANAPNTWQHIVLVKGLTQTKSYLNGVLKHTRNNTDFETNTGKLTGNVRIGATTCGAYLNDFRVYNHCLSDVEVKEISQGLVLHYKLDDLTNGVLDSSGYGHNGEVLNTLSLISDTLRYNVCTHISATNQKIKISNFPTSGFGNSYSFSWWAKISSVTPMHWGFADGIRLNGMYTGRLWNTGDSSNNPLYTPGTTTQVAAPTANVWHHWVMTGDGTTCKVYQDGVYWGVAKTYKAISGQTIYINGWDSGTNYCSDNYSISDFRIYCTALSADDILTLYHTSAKVDNKQNLHTFELIENNSAIKINKCGQTLCNELEEDTATKFYKTNQIIETNEIIEF